MKNAIILTVALFAGIWLAEYHVQPTNLSDAVGLKSDNILTGSERQCLRRYSVTDQARGSQVFQSRAACYRTDNR